MPPKPIEAVASVSQIWMRLSPASSAAGLACSSLGIEGMKYQKSAMATPPATASAPKVVRQPMVWPIQVATGTPITLAAANPAMT
ncbi:hypothetical protein D3C80_1760640 [compost metagenome]